MKKFTSHYTVVGSSALQNKRETTIIEFPGQNVEVQDEDTFQEGRFLRLKNFLNTVPFIEDLKKGSIQGTAFNRSKPWQNALAGSFFFVFALVCIYFGV